MKKYIQSISALNELTLSLDKSGHQKEIERYAESDIFWARSKQRHLQNRCIRKGEIYQFEFGKNLVPEMSYEHRGLVIGASGKLLYVLPICSCNADIQDHKNAVHPVDNPGSSSNYFLLKGTEFPFLNHDSVLKLNDIRTVSFSRIKYQQKNGYIPPSSDTYKFVERLAFLKYFPEYSHKYGQLDSENNELKELLITAESDKAALQSQLDSIKAMLEKHGTDEQCRAFLQKELGVQLPPAAPSKGS